MKKSCFLYGLVLAVSLILAGCSNSESGIIALPNDVKTVVVIGNRNGSEMEPQELEQTEIDDLLIWINQLSLIHRTYDEGEVNISRQGIRSGTQFRSTGFSLRTTGSPLGSTNYSVVSEQVCCSGLYSPQSSGQSLPG